jgi:anti-sigma28 factor (negative regulator of flagellin synthesis)
MMSTEIVNEVAQLMRQKGLGQKDPKDIKVQKSVIETPKDEVELTKTGEFYANTVSKSNEYEKEQFMKVARLKTLVQTGNYKMDDDMVATIAERIAKTFM